MDGKVCDSTSEVVQWKRRCNYFVELCVSWFRHLRYQRPEIGDWIDKQLVPNLNPESSNLRVEIVGRDDHCGFAPVQQLLFKIRASRKVIVVLSENYGQSNQGKYVLSVLDTLHYHTGNDRVVIVTFENDLKVRTLLLRRQRKEEPWSQLQFPDDERDWSMFWESLRSLLTLG